MSKNVYKNMLCGECYRIIILSCRAHREKGQSEDEKRKRKEQSWRAGNDKRKGIKQTLNINTKVSLVTRKF